MSALQLVVLSPEVELLDQRCDFVALPAAEGELGVLKGHAPLVAGLGFGELRVKSGSDTSRYFISGGYVQIRDDQVYILTEKAVDAAKLDAAQLNADLERARGLPTATVEEVAARRRAIEEAQLKLRIQSQAG